MAEEPKQGSNAAQAVIAIAFLVLLIFLFRSCASCNKKAAERDPCDKNSALVAAEDFMRDRLKNPAGADFAWVNYDDAVTIENGQFVVVSYVDATNSFNAMIRTYFKARMTCDNGTFTLVSMETE